MVVTRRSRKVHSHILRLLLLSFAIFGIASAGQITLNFDSVDAAPCVDGTAYLAAAGITITGQASARICAGSTAQSGGGAVAVSGPNLLLLNNPAPTNSTYEYFFDFSSPVSDVSFYRTAIQPDSTGPEWTATALAADDSVISATGEGATFAPPAQLFQLPGSGIVSIEFNSDNTSARTYNTPPIDDFSFITAATTPTPEPSTFIFVGLGLAGMTFLKVRRGGSFKTL